MAHRRAVRAAALALTTISLLTALPSGCGSATGGGRNTLLDGVDLVRMTDQMARSLGADPRVLDAVARNGALRVVVRPARNEMTAEVLPRGQAEAFTARVRALLSQRDPTRFTWILNRDDFYDLRGKELDVPLGPSPDAMNPQYALTAVFTTLTHENSRERSDFYVCSYELSDLRTRNVLWSDSYRVKKSAVKGFLD